MDLSKSDLLEAIDVEVEDRSDTVDTESDEILGLQDLRRAVETEASLTYPQYEWLCYLVGNWREAALREELE
jgi:hypothetical protein